MTTDCDRIESILTFWFGHPNAADYGQYRKAWFIKNASFDAELRQHFLLDYEKAAAGSYDSWKKAAPSEMASTIALLLLFDQFPRNLFRGTPRSFASDPQALALARHIVNSGQDTLLLPAQRFFVYVPFEHSENIADQNRCIDLMAQLAKTVPALDDGFKSGLHYAQRHRAVIERFGRFPHRNEILGRQSTSAEVAFLQQPGSRF